MPSPATDWEAQLVALAIQGDQNAANELFLTIGPCISAAAQSELGPELRSVIDADDICQAVALKVLRGLGGLDYRGRKPFRSWLRKKVVFEVHEQVERHRAKKRDHRRKVSLEDLVRENGLTPELAHALRANSRSIASSISRYELCRLLIEAIDELPEETQQREIVRMHLLEGVPVADVAEELGLTEAQVRRRLSEAQARLARILKGRMGPP
jgi:RNA polymerase sigma factor (sigma-70 family)